MKMLPGSYRHQTTTYIKELWCVWRSLGVYSDGDIAPMALEEAIVGLCIFGRFDQRLFDESLSIIIKYARFISRNRIMSLLQKADEDSNKLFQIIARLLENKNNDSRFSSLSKKSEHLETEPFFTSLDNDVFFTGKHEDPLFLQFGFQRNKFIESVKLRNLSYISNQNQWIKSKLVFGNTVRAGTVMELVRFSYCSAPMIAFNTGYTQKSIWNILTDFESSGLLNKEKSLNRLTYCLSKSGKKAFSPFRINKNSPSISHWIRFGYYLAALSKLPKDASTSFIKSEESRIDKQIKALEVTRRH